MAINPRIDRNWDGPIKASEVGTDYGITLARIGWDFFASPSFKGHVPKPNIAYALAWRWMQELALICDVPYSRLLIALRGEEGEKNGRFHFHCLVGGTTTRNYHSLIHQTEWLWKHQCGGARIDVRQYDRSLAGADYVAKCLGGANAYELGKYSFANSVTLSSSVYRLIAGMDESGERRHGEHIRKNGVVVKGPHSLYPAGGVSNLYDETPSLGSGMVA